MSEMQSEGQAAEAASPAAEPAPAAQAPAQESAPAAPTAPAASLLGSDPAEGGYELALAEGDPLPKEVFDAYVGLASEAKLPKDGAQALLGKLNSLIELSQQAQIKQSAQQWAEQSKADPEFGNAKFGENLAVAKSAFDSFASRELKEMMDATGLGSHPEVLRLFYRVGLAVSQDKVVSGKASAAPRSQAERIYPTMYKRT